MQGIVLSFFDFSAPHSFSCIKTWIGHIAGVVTDHLAAQKPQSANSKKDLTVRKVKAIMHSPGTQWNTYVGWWNIETTRCTLCDWHAKCKVPGMSP